MSVLRTMLVLTLLAPLTAAADIGQIKTLAGGVTVLRGGASIPATLGLRLEAADVVETASDGEVGITFVDNTRMSAGPGSRIELARFRFDATTHDGEFVTRVRRGTLSVISGQMAKRSPDAMKVETPTSVLAVRGTRFLVKVD
ncbi:MAG: FecR domain-containing protein [Ectothiorhodospiraceae bacterium]|nr:FecR domain-containing protein [Chromatiales bacterium]MCP5154403.1 FecR domain-containing protein [Ectothiorhodospiraceae bacterium]